MADETVLLEWYVGRELFLVRLGVKLLPKNMLLVFVLGCSEGDGNIMGLGVLFRLLLTEEIADRLDEAEPFHDIDDCRENTCCC